MVCLLISELAFWICLFLSASFHVLLNPVSSWSLPLKFVIPTIPTIVFSWLSLNCHGQIIYITKTRVWHTVGAQLFICLLINLKLKPTGSESQPGHELECLGFMKNLICFYPQWWAVNNGSQVKLDSSPCDYILVLGLVIKAIFLCVMKFPCYKKPFPIKHISHMGSVLVPWVCHSFWFLVPWVCHSFWCLSLSFFLMGASSNICKAWSILLVKKFLFHGFHIL